MPAGERRIGCEELISYNPDVLFVVYFNEEQHLQIIEMFRHAEFSSLKSVKIRGCILSLLTICIHRR